MNQSSDHLLARLCNDAGNAPSAAAAGVMGAERTPLARFGRGLNTMAVIRGAVVENNTAREPPFQSASSLFASAAPPTFINWPSAGLSAPESPPDIFWASDPSRAHWGLCMPEYPLQLRLNTLVGPATVSGCALLLSPQSLILCCQDPELKAPLSLAATP